MNGLETAIQGATVGHIERAGGSAACAQQNGCMTTLLALNVAIAA